MTLKTPVASHSKNMTFSSQFSDRGAIALTLDNTINSHHIAAGPTPGPRPNTGNKSGGAFQTIVNSSHHRRVQSNDVNTLQFQAAAQSRNINNATTIPVNHPSLGLGLSQGFQTQGSFNVGNSSTVKGNRIVANKFD
jgi:hypothetical protein